jgi:2-dehydropantoate 2-reductase
VDIIVYGAGAVGSVLGGMLSLQRRDVLLIGRAPLVDAVAAEGLRLKSATGEHVVHPRAAVSLSLADVGADPCVLLTVKSHDVPGAVESLAATVEPATPIVCMQNGVASEEAAARRFTRVYGGVVRMTCSMVQPGHASFRALGRVLVGLHPNGTDSVARALAKAFAEAGFDAAASRSITSDKWLKLAVNACSVFHAVIDPRDHDANEFFDLSVGMLEETRRVFKAAKIRARSCDGRDPSIDEMIAELKRPKARRSEHGVKVHNSLWQDLYLKRDRIESEFIFGPLIALGKTHGVPTPYSLAALEAAQRCHQAGAGPERLRVTDVQAAVDRHRRT